MGDIEDTIASLKETIHRLCHRCYHITPQPRSTSNTPFQVPVQEKPKRNRDMKIVTLASSSLPRALKRLPRSLRTPYKSYSRPATETVSQVQP